MGLEVDGQARDFVLAEKITGGFLIWFLNGNYHLSYFAINYGRIINFLSTHPSPLDPWIRKNPFDSSPK